MLNSGFNDAIGSCRIMAIWAPRMRRSWPALLVVRSSPSKPTRPPTMRAPVGSRPTIDRHVVVLPQPDSPTRPRVSPSRIVNEMSSTARTTRVPPNDVKWVLRFWTSSKGGLGPVLISRRSAVALLGVELDPQPVAEQLGRQHDQHDAQPRNHGQPPLAGHQGRARLGEHQAPGRLGPRHAYA